MRSTTTTQNSTVFFRCDASMRIGSGHVMRCLNLADLMKERGWSCGFIVNEEALSVVPSLEQSGYKILHDEQDLVCQADLAIIDHYELGIAYEKAARQWAKKILVIDDIFRENHDCDFLMNYAILNKSDEKRHHVLDSCLPFFGLGYVILKGGFLAEPKDTYVKPAKKVHLFFGASDVINLTLRCLQHIIEQGLHTNTIFEIVITQANPDKDEIVKVCNQFDNLNLYIQIPDLSVVIRKCDLAFGVGGVAMWERLATGVPTIEFAHSDIQLETLFTLKDMNVIQYAGIGKEIDRFFESGKFESSINSPPVLKKLKIGHKIDSMIKTIEENLS